jgi:hypothetical protein
MALGARLAARCGRSPLRQSQRCRRVLLSADCGDAPAAARAYRSIRQGFRELAYDIEWILALGGVTEHQGMT